MAEYPWSPKVLDSHWRIQSGQETCLPSQYWVKIGWEIFGLARKLANTLSTTWEMDS